MGSNDDLDQGFNDEVTTRIAQDLREQVRRLNYATGDPPSLTRPSTAYAVLGNLAEAAYGLRQTIDQLQRFLRRELAAGRLGHDQGDDLTEVIDEASHTLAEARHRARALSEALSDSQNAISAVHGPVSSKRRRRALQTAGGEAEQATQALEHGRQLAAEDFSGPVTVAPQTVTPITQPAVTPPAPARPGKTTRKGV